MGIIFSLCGCFDCKYRKIPTLFIVLIIIGGFLINKDITVFERFAGFTATAIPLFLLLLTGGKIKGGDYKFLVASSLALGISAFLKSLFWASGIALLWSFIKKEKSVPLAFVFAVGYILNNLM